jgi:phosphate starvation-inducible membrane PsiE
MCANKKLSVMTESLQGAKQQINKFKNHFPVRFLLYGGDTKLKVRHIVARSGLHKVSLNQVVVLCAAGAATWLIQ